MKQLKHNSFTTRRTLLATALVATAIPTVAENLMLEEVLVTAQKRQQTVQDVPSSVAAFSSEMLEQSNTRDFDDLSKIASGMEITASGDGFGSIIRIRGVGNNAFAPAIRPAVGIFLDEIPLTSTEAAYNNMADIERIEVLKGPQATLFGKEVSSGAISLFTRRPNTEEIDAYVEGNFGNLGLQEFRIGGNLPLGDQFAARASVYQNDRDANIKNIITEHDGGERDADGYRLRLMWEPSDTFNAILGYENHDIEISGTTSVAQDIGDLLYSWEQYVVGITDPAESTLVVLDPADMKTNHAAPTLRNTATEIWSLHVDWLINDEWSFTSVTSDQEYTLDTRGLNDSGFTNSDGIVVPPSPGSSVAPYQINNFLQDTGTDGFTQEFRFTYDSDSWSSIIGFFYADTEFWSYVDFNLLAGVIPTPADPIVVYAPGLSSLEENTTEWAIFTHNIYSLREGLDLTFGLRYAEVEKDSAKGQLVGDAGLFGDFAHPLVPSTPWSLSDLPDREDSWDEITGTLKLTWWLNDEISVYGGWDRGFKAGGHDVCKGTEESPVCPEPFDSEIADNFEVGLKGRFLGNTLVLNTAAFYQTYDDYQVEIQDEVGIGNTVQNAAKAEIQGAEMDFQWLAGEHLLLDGNLAYVDARWDEYEDAGCLRPQYQAIACGENADGSFTQDLSGKRLNYTSPWSANLNATWSDQFRNGLSWYLRGEVAFRDDRFFFPDLDPEVVDGSYTLLNASFGLSGASGHWDIILWGKNLADEDYLTTGSRNRDANQFPYVVGPAYESWRTEAGLERTYGITLKYRFGGV